MLVWLHADKEEPHEINPEPHEINDAYINYQGNLQMINMSKQEQDPERFKSLVRSRLAQSSGHASSSIYLHTR